MQQHKFLLILLGLYFSSAQLCLAERATLDTNNLDLKIPFVKFENQFYEINLSYQGDLNFQVVDINPLTNDSASEFATYSSATRILTINYISFGAQTLQATLQLLADNSNLSVLDYSDISETNTNIASILDDWVINNTETAAVMRNSDGSDFFVNVQNVSSVEDGGQSYALIEASGVPNYRFFVTQEIIDSLNARPLAASDFVSGQTILTAGETVEFGVDIGYDNSHTGEPCPAGKGYGYWPPGPVCPENTEKQGYFPVNPIAESEDTVCETGLSSIGYAVNGVSIFNWGDGHSYNDEGQWQTLAPEAEFYDVDICGGHAADGDYHHHFYSACWAEMAGEQQNGHSVVYAYAADGYAVYGPWEGKDNLAKSCWVARDYSAESSTGCGVDGERSCVLVNQYDPTEGTTAASAAGPSTSDTYISISSNIFSAASGAFFEDYYYDSACTQQSDSEYLDEFNGHSDDVRGYHYHVTVTSDNSGNLTPSFPYIIGPKYKGTLASNSIAGCSSGNIGMGGGPQGGGRPPR